MIATVDDDGKNDDEEVPHPTPAPYLSEVRLAPPGRVEMPRYPAIAREITGIEVTWGLSPPRNDGLRFTPLLFLGERRTFAAYRR